MPLARGLRPLELQASVVELMEAGKQWVRSQPRMAVLNEVSQSGRHPFDHPCDTKEQNRKGLLRCIR